jgi:hypothetical protein
MLKLRRTGINHKSQSGYLSLTVILFSGIAIIILSGFIIWADSSLKAVYRINDNALAFKIAESGIEYYRWHLAHDPDDFQDGTGQPGPYVHQYYDKNGVLLGEFSLDIIPPSAGSTLVEIESTGRIDWDNSIEKTVRVRLAKQSFAKFSAVVNADVRFGSGTEVFGEIHSNQGIRFDGLAHNIVTSALEFYDDPDHSGGYEWAVHTHVAPTDPLYSASLLPRPDIFEAGRQVLVPAVDFDGITQSLADMKTDAQVNGFYRGDSGENGYDVVFKVDDTFDLYEVNSLVPRHWSCSDYSAYQSGWGTWSIQTETFLGNYPNPANGIIFIEDDVWARGQVNTSRVTVASGRFPENPSTWSSVTINNDLLYSNYDGSDAIALIAQYNVNIGMVSQDILRVDAALMAQNGRIGRYYYRPPWWVYPGCSPYHDRDIITTYGMIATNQRYGFAYTNNTGYDIRNLIYDANLLYAPPPSFPLTSDAYEQISWEEIK